MTGHHYILNDSGVPIVCNDFNVWGEWFKGSKRIVRQDTIGKVMISTVFLGIDHNYGSDCPPILWETMIFNGKHDQYQDRCSGSREQAESMHAKAYELVTGKSIEGDN